MIKVYSDLNCPYCYALHAHLQVARPEQMEYCWVQHAPALRIPLRPSPAMTEMLQEEVQHIQHIIPELDIRPPPAKPNTGPAIRLLAKATLLNPLKTQALATRLFQAFWREGRDLSAPAVLQDACEAVAIPEGFDLTPESDA
ncbi:MAG: DsbA family oxidoreductase, partial [Nitrospiraceae bacterium]